MCSQCTLSPAPENIGKPYGFLMFSGGREAVYFWKKWVKQEAFSHKVSKSGFGVFELENRVKEQ